jgi:hypothetical protein
VAPASIPAVTATPTPPPFARTPPAPADVTPPLARLTGRTQKLGRTVAIGIRCIDEACVATASGTVRVPGTGRRRARSYQLRAVTAAVATGGPATARLALPASMRRALTLGREIVVRVRVEVADRAGNTRRLARQIPLRL